MRFHFHTLQEQCQVVPVYLLPIFTLIEDPVFTVVWDLVFTVIWKTELTVVCVK